jgi:RimJ/RimL family protein N-acetyltransferase
MLSTPVEAEVVLRDGSTVHVRPITPEDRDRMRAFLGSLSEDSRRLRYFSGAANLDWATAAAIEASFPGSYGIVATRGNDRIVAHAMYGMATDDTAEVAFAVADELQGMGLATILLSSLAEAAEASGIRWFEAEVLPENHRMLDVFRDSGFAMTTHSLPGTIHLDFPTHAERGRGFPAPRRVASTDVRSVRRAFNRCSTPMRESQMTATKISPNGKTHDPVTEAPDRPSGPVTPPLPTDQEKFDASVNRNGKIVLQVLGGAAIFGALLMSIIALLVSTGKSDSNGMTMPPVAATPAPATAQLINVSVAGENKRGPDGKMHDSFSKTDFAVKVGQPTRLRITNKDDVPHSITAAAAGVSITVLPGTHTYTLVAKTAGRFEWMCVIPCDSPSKGWAMTHPGYMAGYITAT